MKPRHLSFRLGLVLLSVLFTCLLPGPDTHAAEIHDAVADGNLAKVQALIEKNPALVGLRDDNGGTPLHEAARKGHLAIAEYLLDQKADPSARDRSNLTPLKLATGYGRKDVADLLQKRGASAPPRAPQAARPPATTAPPRERVAAGAGTDLPINVAAKAGDVAAVRALLQASPQEANATNSRGVTPLQLASSQGHQAVVELLLEGGANVQAQATNGWTALLAAARQTNLAIVKLLLARNADVNATDQFRQTPLLGAARRGQWPIAQALLAAKADPNRQDAQGECALSLFARFGNREAVLGLLAAGANPNLVQTDLGVTALHYAASRGDQPVVEALVTHKADVNVVDHDGFTPLSHALLTGHNQVAEFLRQKGAIEAPEKVWPEPQRSLIEQIKKFDTALRTGARAEQLQAFAALEPTPDDLSRIFGGNAAKAGRIVAEEKLAILAELSRSRPPSREGEIIRVIPKEPMLAANSRALIAPGLPLHSVTIIRKGESSTGDPVYCFVNQRWVRLPSLLEFSFQPPP